MQAVETTPAPVPTLGDRITAFGGRVEARATQVRPGRMLLLALAMVLFAPGWLVGIVWVALRWALAAVAEGFVTATGQPERGPAGRGEA
ncbi:hypothetical protein [Catellatospora sp. NPDC049609]|uniref:hypothetical protein n=1 Tax=Catellatospora sp. NPDC049609 TaxID=3155505 RepID=UPI003426D721